MTKKDIVKTISEENGLPQLQIKKIVDQTFSAIVDTLVSEGRIELRNFGVFEVKQRKPRMARNPRTGENVEVPAKFVVTFKPGKEMDHRVSQMESTDGNSTESAQLAQNSTDESGNLPGNQNSGIPYPEANSHTNDY